MMKKTRLEGFEIREILLILSAIIMYFFFVLQKEHGFRLVNFDIPITNVLIWFMFTFILIEFVAIVVNAIRNNFINCYRNVVYTKCPDNWSFKIMVHDNMCICYYGFVLIAGVISVLNLVKESISGYSIEAIDSFDTFWIILKDLRVGVLDYLWFTLICFALMEFGYRFVKRFKLDSNIEGKLGFKFSCFFGIFLLELFIIFCLDSCYPFLDLWNNYNILFIMYICICWAVGRHIDKTMRAYEFRDFELW